jgi:hypothetical protein
MSIQGTRLESWKEIAQYLGRNERTVQRWELERGLPVHRLPGPTRGGIFAFTEELDSWRARTSESGGTEPDEHVLPAGEEAVTPGIDAGRSNIHPPSHPILDGFVDSLHNPSHRRSLFLLGVCAAALLISAALFFFLGYRKSSESLSGAHPFLIQQLTFRRGTIRAARFRPDGGNVVYDAIWEDSPVMQLYETSLGRPESSPLRVSAAQLLNISRSSTLAILLNPIFIGPYMQSGTLAVQGLYEDKPLAISPNVDGADWGADSTTLYYTVIDRSGVSWIQSYSQETHQTKRIYPAAKPDPSDSHIRYSNIRVSPNGDMLAFEQRRGIDNGGEVVILRIAGGTPLVSRHFGSLAGLAWPPQEKEVWFTAAEKGTRRSIYAIRVSGGERLVYQATDTLTLQDISKNGDVLATREFTTSDVFAKKADESSNVIDLSMFDLSSVGDISADGKKVAIFEDGDATRKPSVYLREISGGPATSLGEASSPVAFSPDGHSLLALSNEECARVVLLSPERLPQILTRANLCAGHAVWTPDGHHIVFDATEPGHKPRCYSQTVGGADARPFTAEDFHCSVVSPDGKFALAQNEKELFKVPTDGSQAPVKVDFPSGDMGRPQPIRWITDNKIVFNDGIKPDLMIVDLATGKTSVIPVKLPSRVMNISSVRVSADLKSIVYGGYYLKSDLFLFRGLR